MQVISLYWFAAQQKTSTLRRQKIGLFDVKLFFLKATGNDQKMAKTKVVRKNANWRHSETKG